MPGGDPERCGSLGFFLPLPHTHRLAYVGNRVIAISLYIGECARVGGGRSMDVFVRGHVAGCFKKPQCDRNVSIDRHRHHDVGLSIGSGMVAK
jgi:hypothetical protein